MPQGHIGGEWPMQQQRNWKTSWMNFLQTCRFPPLWNDMSVVCVLSLVLTTVSTSAALQITKNLLGRSEESKDFHTLQFGHKNNILDTAVVVPSLCVVKEQNGGQAALVSYAAARDDYWQFWSAFSVNFTTATSPDGKDKSTDFLHGKQQTAIFLDSYYHNNMHHFVMDNAISLHSILQSMNGIKDNATKVLFLSKPRISRRDRWLEAIWKAMNIDTHFHPSYDYRDLVQPVVCFDKAVFAFTQHLPFSPGGEVNVSIFPSGHWD